MSLYENETKIYPDRNPTAPQVEPQTYRLNKLSEIKKREQQTKKMK